jgi:hypothetical protein
MLSESNAPAIQPAAAVLSCVVTLILAIIIWKYVQVTKTIAVATKKPVIWVAGTFLA